jgi:predicted transposase YdaD
LTELAMTLADRIRQEGHQEGHKEGRLEGETLSRRQSLLEILEVRFGTLPEGLAETISVISDPDRLKALHRSALTCPDLEAFASCL